MKWTLVVFIFLFLISSILYGRVMINGDGFTYYALARSLSEDHDFDLRNQRLQIPYLHLKINPVTRKVVSQISFGFGIFYAPFIFLSDGLSRLFPAFLNSKPYQQNEFIPFPHSLAIFTGSLVYGFLSLIFCYLTLIRTKVLSIIALFSTIAVFIGTSLFFYVFTTPSYAHAVDAFLTSFAFFLVAGAGPFMVRKTNLSNVLLGLILAGSVVLRNNNIALVPPMILGALFLEVTRRDRKLFVVLTEIVLGTLPFLIPLILFNLAQYGKIIATGYRVQLEEVFLPEMLFHPDAGLFIWTPVSVLGLIGLIAGSIRRKVESWVALCCVLLAFLSIQFQANWWGGCSFGPRFFAHLLPFWAVGLAEDFLFPRKTFLSILTSVCVVWTFFLFHIFFINAVSADFRKILRADKCKCSPVLMIQNAADEYRAAKEENRATNPIGFWFDATRSGRFPTVLGIFQGKKLVVDETPESDQEE